MFQMCPNSLAASVSQVELNLPCATDSEMPSTRGGTSVPVEDEQPPAPAGEQALCVFASKYLDNQVKDDGRALRKRKEKNPENFHLWRS